MADEPELETGAQGAPEAQPSTPGAKLRAAREARGLSIQDVATRTRIAQRQLEAVERDDYAALPGIPYAVGFARAYARAVDLDEVAIAAQVRHGVHNSDMGARYEAFEPVDPARVPPRRLAWVVLAIVVVLIAGYTIWRTQLMTLPTGEEIAQEQAQPAAARPAGADPVAPAAQPVVFTAIDDVWLRIYDDAGERLKDGLLKKGESFTLPSTAKGPMILTGRPQALSVTVGGKVMPPLGAADRTIADVPVSAEALLARGEAPAEAMPARGTRPSAAPSRPAQRRTAPAPASSEISAPPAPAAVAPAGDGAAAPQP
ncbi:MULTISPECIES: helix-turn-helix domain-containing protein [Sphingobium]|uniref:XRE family transcriptional regulator n=1 Tax=Sphingobium cupriresistens LL01 TaxID=1420583 RepID=A0A0J7Y077_9SPHN|nr:MULTISPECIES: helix-turn-helix domain-containing protein [Sphingobium]KMS57306.1 XRE family transcriptional regulator [Sphingobium cupriresistens LL01]MBJ7378926.1 helix-turn-helix domain-containing protein [Sphingobium sp.]